MQGYNRINIYTWNTDEDYGKWHYYISRDKVFNKGSFLYFLYKPPPKYFQELPMIHKLAYIIKTLSLKFLNEDRIQWSQEPYQRF